MPTFEITGNAQNRFIQAAALLRLPDPVRVEPTAYSLDRDSNTVEQDLERLLKRKCRRIGMILASPGKQLY